MVSVVNPAQVRFFARSHLRRGKTDALDAEMIARFGVAMKPKQWHPSSSELETLKLIMRQHEALIGMLVEEKNRRHAHQARAAMPQQLIALTQEYIAFIEQQLAEFERSFKQQLQASEHQADVELMESVPGIGFVIATLLTETVAFGTMHHSKQLSAYAGLSPMPYESGRLQKPRHISKIGNPRVRKAVYMAALSAVRTRLAVQGFLSASS